MPFKLPKFKSLRRALLPLLQWIGVASLLWAVIAVIHVWYVASRSTLHKQQLLVYQIDHQTLLTACIWISDHSNLFRTNPNWIGTPRGDLSNPDPTDPQIPAVIRSLNPTYIVIEPHSVRLEFGGGFYHFGVSAMTDGSVGNGNRMLMRSLWYYSEDGNLPDTPAGTKHP